MTPSFSFFFSHKFVLDGVRRIRAHTKRDSFSLTTFTAGIINRPGKISLSGNTTTRWKEDFIPPVTDAPFTGVRRKGKRGAKEKGTLAEREREREGGERRGRENERESKEREKSRWKVEEEGECVSSVSL